MQVHGLLHLLGFDHEISEEAEEEMEREEELLLKSLGWKGKGLIQSAYEAKTESSSRQDNSNGNCAICKGCSPHVVSFLGSIYLQLIQALSSVYIKVSGEIILQMNCQKTGGKKAVLDFINQSSAISSAIWMVRSF